jgi:hypothetical protein
VDLTAAAHRNPSFLKELLRWRTLLAAEYLEEAPRPEAAETLLRALLLTGPSARQLPYL